MAYEYSSESRRLDFPNPYRVENVFLLTAAALLIGCALAMFFIGRAKLVGSASPWSLMPIGLGVGLLVFGLYLGSWALSQLRFFFGRGQPVGLAPELGPDQDGSSGNPARVAKDHSSVFIKETVRQGALSYTEPKGPLNGLLYSWIPSLIFAPEPVQKFAQAQFRSGVVLLVTLASFLIAWITVPSGNAASWLGLCYFGITVLALMPVNGIKLLVSLILASIFLPVLLGLTASSLWNLAWLPMILQTFALLLASSVATVLFFIALMHHTPPPPRTEITWKQLSLSLNAHPKQLLDELEREMQKLWTEKIPNRRYERVTPQVNLAQESGDFIGQFLEETQPMPPDDMRRLTFTGAFSEPRYRWLAMLNAFGIVLLVLAVVALIIVGDALDPRVFSTSVLGWAIFGFAMLVVALYSFFVSHKLWGRFDFLSTLYWVEMKGNYQAARMDYGNQWTDRMKTQKQVINVENMTLRVWVAELNTVTFGKNDARHIVAMHGIPKQTEWLAQHLAWFANEQSMLVAPTAQADEARIQRLAAINQSAGAGSLPPPVARMLASPAADCPQCHAPVDTGAAFCNDCGAKLTVT
jgi:hypothetical protein